jgi:hypothetical protein
MATLRASWLDNALVRRLRTPLPDQDFVVVELAPWDAAAGAEAFVVTTKVAKRSEVRHEFTMARVLQALGVVPDPAAAGDAELDPGELESALMVDGRLSDSERSKLFTIIRELRTGRWPDGAPAEQETHEDIHASRTDDERADLGGSGRRRAADGERGARRGARPSPAELAGAGGRAVDPECPGDRPVPRRRTAKG